MPPTPIEQLKREALAGLQYHPDDIAAVKAATLAKQHSATLPIQRKGERA